MPTEHEPPCAPAVRTLPCLRSVLRQLPRGGLERRAVEAGEIDAVIDYGNANVIVFPAARRALRHAARRTSVAGPGSMPALPEGNRMLAALPRPDLRRLLPALEPVDLTAGDVLHEAEGFIQHVYFPVDCVVGLLTRTDEHRSVGTGLVGHEGMVGLSLALGVGISSVRAVVQIAGTALRMPALQFRIELQRGLHLRHALYRHAQAELDQARQTAACIGSHVFEQRLACWLLMFGDRARSQQLLLTQENLATILNVRRVSVTLASHALRSRGLIRYHRGRIVLLDRDGLTSASCRCYRPIEPDDVAGRLGVLGTM